LKRLFLLIGAISGLCLLAGLQPALAHHGTAAYDLDKVLILKGTVTNFYWMNPHSEILLDVKDQHGNVEHWAIETHPPTMLVSHGWTRRALSAGDQVTITVHPAKNGASTGILVKVVLPDGRELKHDV
jgi:hypothetical protein